MPNGIIADAGERMKKAVGHLGHEFSTVRTGRASGAVLEDVKVEYYGSQMPVTQVATVKSPEPHMLTVEPWDKGMLSAIEKAIQASDLGINPSNDGTMIRLPFPPLTEERRRDLVKQCKGYAEEAKVAVRAVRHDAIKQLERQDKDGEISQDDARRGEAEVQKLTDARITEIDEMLKRKEAEIMEV
ncbi:MAG TPA: ribosome recycling factor [Coriobacteriia bacterium]